jgi:hypothetical protein
MKIMIEKEEDFPRGRDVSKSGSSVVKRKTFQMDDETRESLFKDSEVAIKATKRVKTYKKKSSMISKDEISDYKKEKDRLPMRYLSFKVRNISPY